MGISKILPNNFGKQSIVPRIFVSWYGNRFVPENALKVQISTSCPVGMKDDMDVYFRSLYPDFNSMVKAHKDGVIDDREYIRRYVSSVIKPNKKAILRNVGRLQEMAAEKGGDIYLFCWCAPGKFCHRYIVRDFLRENGIECSEPECDIKRYAGGEYVLPEGETVANSKVEEEQGWSRYADNGYEVSSKGDSRFSAFHARFAVGTCFAGHDVSGMSIEEVYQTIIKGYPDVKSGKGNAPCRWSPLTVIHRGYATDEMTEASDLKQTVAGTASDYLEGIEARYHFTTERWEAEGYAESHADSSEEPCTGKRNRHYSGSIPHVSSYVVKPGVPFVLFDNLHDFNRNRQRVGDVPLVILKTGTLSTGASEFVLRDGMESFVKKLDNPPSREDLNEISYGWYKKLWELWASQNKTLVDELDRLSAGKPLTDCFASTSVSQARALSEILTDRRRSSLRNGSGKPLFRNPGLH